MQLCMGYDKVMKRKLQIPLLLYSYFLGAIIVDIGGGFGLKYVAFIGIFIYLIISLLVSKLKLSLYYLIIEILLFFVAPFLFFFLAIGPFSVKPIMALEELTPFATWILYPLLLQISNKDKIINFFTTALFWGLCL